MQPDSIIPDQTNTQSWNRFSYAENDPINFADTSGHFKCSVNTKSFEGGEKACQEAVETLLAFLEEKGGEEGKALVDAFRNADTIACRGRGACSPKKDQITIVIQDSTALATYGTLDGKNPTNNSFSLSPGLFEKDKFIGAGSFGHEIQHLVQSQSLSQRITGVGNGSLYGEIDAYDTEWKLYQNMGLTVNYYDPKVRIAAYIAGYKGKPAPDILRSDWANSRDQYENTPLRTYSNRQHDEDFYLINE